MLPNVVYKTCVPKWSMSNCVLPYPVKTYTQQTKNLTTTPPLPRNSRLSLIVTARLHSVSLSKDIEEGLFGEGVTMADYGVFTEIIEEGVFKYYSDREWKKSSSGKSVAIVNPTTRKTQYRVQGMYALFISVCVIIHIYDHQLFICMYIDR